jgi:hypothetical protein
MKKKKTLHLFNYALFIDILLVFNFYFVDWFLRIELRALIWFVLVFSNANNKIIFFSILI